MEYKRNKNHKSSRAQRTKNREELTEKWDKLQQVAS